MAALKHLDGCPDGKDGEEKYTRTFMRKGKWMTAEVTRCRTCGARQNTKPKERDD